MKITDRYVSGSAHRSPVEQPTTEGVLGMTTTPTPKHRNERPTPVPAPREESAHPRHRRDMGPTLSERLANR